MIFGLPSVNKFPETSRWQNDIGERFFHHENYAVILFSEFRLTAKSLMLPDQSVKLILWPSTRKIIYSIILKCASSQ